MRIFVLTILCLVLASGLTHVEETFFPAKGDVAAKNKCVNGKDVHKLNSKEYLREFAKGPCNPVINVPAMTSGRIMLDMVCSQAKTNYAKTWETCGYFVPCWKKSVQVFPPSMTLVASFMLQNPINGKENFLKCFMELFKLNVTVDKTGKAHYYQKEGITSRPQWEGAYNFGSVERKESCGFRANNKIVNGPSFISQLQIDYLAEWWDEYKHLGYRANLSIFNYAYDWRYDANTAADKWGFKNMAETLYALTNKPIVVAGHSYGVNVGYSGMSMFDKPRRQKIFKSFIAVGGPWLGAYIPFDYQNGTPMPLPVAFPGPANSMQEMFASLGVLYTLNPKDFWLRYADADFTQKTRKMIKYYKGQTKTNPFSWMPSTEKLCDSNQKQIALTETVDGKKVPGVQRWMSCDFGFRPMTKLAKIAGKDWMINQIGEWQTKFGARPDAGTLWKNWNTYKESGFENFGLLTYFMVQNNLPTPHQKEYTGVEKDGRTLIQKDSKQIQWAGDATVPFASLLGPVFKWAEEFDSKKIPGAKPVKLIHYCNNLGKRSLGQYQTNAQWHKEFHTNANSYLGLPCQCGTPSFFQNMIKGGPQLGDVCNHSASTKDPNVHAFFNKVMIDEKPHNAKLSAWAEALDDKYLDNLASHCIIEKSYFLENWKKNFQGKDSVFLHDDRAGWRRRRLMKHAN